MAGLSATRAEWEELRELPYSSLSSSFMSVGTSFGEPVRALLLQNSTDVTVYISFDGIKKHWVLIKNSQLIVDISSNDRVTMSRGSQVYAKIKSGTPTEGDIYVGAVTAASGV
jgi:hypothetical protein